MAHRRLDSFSTRSQLRVRGRTYDIFRLDRLESDLSRIPFSIKVLLENLLRNEDNLSVDRDDILALQRWDPGKTSEQEIAFMPARALLQDFTGVPAVCDLASMRDAMVRLGGNPSKINPLQPVDLVIDHSVQVDQFGNAEALRFNSDREFERNRERYQLLRWAQTAFSGFRAVPPDTGIVHQVNLEYLASVVFSREEEGVWIACPDSLVGTDSHTTMVNGLGVLGWGVGGIEAEAAMLGQPSSMLIPDVIGFRLHGRLPSGATATDLVLTVTQALRKRGVVGKFVEFCGEGLSCLSLADRATLANMAPEYGATVGFFPVDDETLNYLRFTGRHEDQIALVETYCKEQGLWRQSNAPDPLFTDVLELDLGSVEPSLAGPRRPQDRVPLRTSRSAFRKSLVEMLGEPAKLLKPEDVERWINAGGAPASPVHDVERPDMPLGALTRDVDIKQDGLSYELRHGSVVIAAITSCTNTSNPSVLIAAGLLAKKAVEHGLQVKPWVKTSLAPGSKVVTDYLIEARLQPYLDALRFHTVGYGCTTCIGNSGPLPEHIAHGIKEGALVAVAVLSGNRNFEGRINPFVRANYLASPPLVVAYALAGTMDIDFERQPIGHDGNGQAVYLREIWPDPQEVRDTMQAAVKPEMFKARYGDVIEGDDNWQNLDVPEGDRFVWDAESTYIKCPPFFDGMTLEPPPLKPICGARALAVLGDSVTTDHISPAGSIAVDSPAGRYLIKQGVEPKDFNSYGARRGNHEVMVRGTFANIRLRNQLAPGTEGGWTQHLPSGRQMTIYEASLQYQVDRVSLLVIAGAEYGTGSSRDWAAKGTMLLGVNAVIAKSFERIHRSNLVGMGVLPLQFNAGEDLSTYGLTGRESFDILGLEDGVRPGQRLTVKATADSGEVTSFQVQSRIDTPQEVIYYLHGGILPFALRQLVVEDAAPAS